MNLDKIFIPTQLYATFKKENEDEDATLLAFLSPYDDTKAGLKRRKTQLDWAYDCQLRGNYRKEYLYIDRLNKFYSLSCDYNEKTGETKFYKWEIDEFQPIVETTEIDQLWYKYPPTIPMKKCVEVFEHELMPRIVDNSVALIGYKLSNMVRRIYWGGGNVVWRLVDPMGFEFEISSANLARILDCCNVSEGVIEDPCIFARCGSVNLLIPVSSELYEIARANTEKRKNA